MDSASRVIASFVKSVGVTAEMQAPTRSTYEFIREKNLFRAPCRDAPKLSKAAAINTCTFEGCTKWIQTSSCECGATFTITIQ